MAIDAIKNDHVDLLNLLFKNGVNLNKSFKYKDLLDLYREVSMVN